MGWPGLPEVTELGSGQVLSAWGFGSSLVGRAGSGFEPCCPLGCGCWQGQAGFVLSWCTGYISQCLLCPSVSANPSPTPCLGRVPVSSFHMGDVSLVPGPAEAARLALVSLGQWPWPRSTEDDSCHLPCGDCRSHWCPASFPPPLLPSPCSKVRAPSQLPPTPALQTRTHVALC